MNSLRIDIEAAAKLYHLDTIEERSQECTPIFDLSRQVSRDWAKLQCSSINKSNLVSISEDDESIQVVTEVDNPNEFVAVSMSSKILLNKLASLKTAAKHLRKRIEKKQQQISETDTENSELQEKVKELSDEKKTKLSSDMCKSLCSIV